MTHQSTRSCTNLIAALLGTIALGGTPASAQSPAASAVAAERISLLAADSAWSARARLAGFARAFSDIAAPEVFYLTAGQPIIRGTRDVATFLARDTTFLAHGLTVRPVKAGLSADLSLGYTAGYTESLADAAGTREYGKYITMWKHLDGAWHIVALVLAKSPGQANADSVLAMKVPVRVARGAADDARSARAQAMQADSAFSRLAGTSSIADAFGIFAANDAMILSADSSMTRGPRAIHANFENLPAGTRLTWAPVGADAASSGDLAFTVGEATITVPTGPSAPARASFSKYLTVWEKQSNGEWRYVLDGGSSRPAP